MMDFDHILIALTLLAGAYMAWNIGANDVANAMGTSIGSKALSWRQAVVIAAVLEFLGAVLVGGNVAQTVQAGLVNPAVFMADPMVYVLGMLSALVGSAVWLQAASYFGWPVSTTHAIVGSVVGFGAIVGGVSAVSWLDVAIVASSWVLSPVLAGMLAFCLFLLLQRLVLRAAHPALAAHKLAPWMVLITLTILSLSVLFEGLKNLQLHLSFEPALLLSLCIGAAGFGLVRLFSRSAPSEIAMDAEYGQVERTFAGLQVLSACSVAFAHGANDVANAIGPVAGCLHALQSHTVSTSAAIPLWLLVAGGAGIVLGLVTWGYRVIHTVGHRITQLTPTRGFTAEFSAATTILLASKSGIPISTTHALIGAIVGVAMARGFHALNVNTLRDIVGSWIATIPAAAVSGIVVFTVLKFIFL